MSCERMGHVGAEDAGNQPKYRCLYCGQWGYRPSWQDNCCEHDGEEYEPGTDEKMYPDICDHECHRTDEDEREEHAL